MAKVNTQSTGKAVGIVKSLIGNATATDAQGVTRALHIGDQVYANEIVNAAAAGGTIHIEFTNSGFATLASGQTLTLDNSVFGPATETQAPQQDENALQAQIAAGLDPTLVAEAAAAGAAGSGGGADGGHQFVVVEQNAARGDVTPGFDTGTSGNSDVLTAEYVGTELRAEAKTPEGNVTPTSPAEPIIPQSPPVAIPPAVVPPAPPAPPEENVIPPPPPAPPEDNVTQPPPAPQPEGDTYDARAVMYTADNPDGTHTLALTGVNVDSYSWKDPAGADYFDVDLSDDGLLTFTLKDGVSLPADFANLYNYIEVVSGGTTYTVQLIVNQDNQFDSAAEDADTSHGASLAAGGLIPGEWHAGKDFTQDGTINPSSNLADQVTFGGNLSSGSINTAGGDDTITIGGQMKGGSTILASGEVGNRATDDTNTITVKGGMAAAAGETNLIHTNAGNVNVNVENKGIALGLNAIGSGSNIVEATNVEIRTGTSGTSTGHAQGIHVAGGINKVTADTVTIDVQSKTTGTAAVGGSATGMVADSGTNTIEVGKELDIHAQSAGRYAYGLHAQSGTNIINAAENAKVTISAESASGNAYGLYTPGGKNIITADQLEISADSAATNKTAYGLGADNRGTNTIEGTGNAGIEVRITVTAGSAANALAMYAGTGSVNKITGSDYSDTISLKGNIKTGGSGQNIINTGGGSDTIAIEGSVSGLTLIAGEGYDVLVLTASSTAEFNTRYEAWLKTSFKTMEIEKIEIVIKDSQGGNVLDLSLGWLNTLASNANVPMEWISDPALPVADSIAPAMATMAAFADTLDDQPAVASTSAADTNDHSVNLGSESQPDTATVQLADTTEQTPVEISALDQSQTTLLGETGETALNYSTTESEHQILLADDAHLPENVTYDSLVDDNGHVNLDAIHDIRDSIVADTHTDLHGGAGNDLLIGGAGENILQGGAGDDIMLSGTGPTTFVYEKGDLDHVVNGDRILDFKLGEDVLDISDLLAGAAKPDSVSGLFDGGFLNFEQITKNEDGSTTVKLSIDTDGSAGNAAAAVPLAEITINGLNLGNDASKYTEEIMNQLVHNEIKF